MNYCKTNHAYVTNLRLTVGTETVACPSNAKGYWQAHGMPSVQGLECDEELHKWRGIGWVEGDDVHIIWSARDPQTHQVVFWRDIRSAKNQAQIIWAQPNLHHIVDEAKGRGDAEVRNLKKFQDKIVGEGGLPEAAIHSH
jgi:hypothetical protein